MTIAARIKRSWSQWSGNLLQLALLSLIILGLMDIIHNLSYREPSDGCEWAMVNGALEIKATDPESESGLEVGDRLSFINDQEITTEGELFDFLYELGADYDQPVLYQVMRSGSPMEYWVEIKGMGDPDAPLYMVYAVTGFVFAIFLILILSRNVSFQSRRWLAFFCFCLFLNFVFRHTDNFALLDWLALYLDKLGDILLPSSIAAVALSQSLGKTRWLGHIQAIHWLPTLILLAAFIYVNLNIQTLGGEMLDSLDLVLDLWGGSLIVLALLVLGLVAELRLKERNLSVYWVFAFGPQVLSAFGLEYPFHHVLPGVTPLVLPVAYLFEWSRSGELYLGNLGKKVLVYFSVVFLVLVGYSTFIAVFQALLGAKISSGAHMAILGIGIMFASVSYAPLNHYAAETLDRLIYGKRYKSIRELSDLSEINRADTNIDDFLFLILGRIKNAFPVEKGSAFKAGENTKIFKTIVPVPERLTLVFEELPLPLTEGEIVRGNQVKAHLIDRGVKDPFNSNDYICPIRVKDQLAALLIFTLSGNDLKLNPDEERLLKSLMHQCDVLMENMELYHTVNQKVFSINQLREYNENIIESSRLGILTTDEMGRTVSCNQAMADLAGLDKSKIMGNTFDGLFVTIQMNNQRQNQAGFNMEGSFENAKRDEVILEIQRTPLKTKENEVYGTLYLVEDVREKRKMNESLMQQEKLASIGLLAAGVAHEINTPLTGIASYSQLLAGDPNITDDQKELLDLIQDQSRRAAKIVSELLNFSRKDRAAPKGPVDLMDVLNQTLRFLSHQIQKNGVRLSLGEPNEPAIIEGYDNQIQQVFLNLIVNAMDAMPEGGNLDIDIRLRRNHVTMTFQDSGQGMDAQTKTSIFDPFFTTKEVGKGTGLGLAVVYSILQDHEAMVEVESRVGEGTEFLLRFPRLRGGERQIRPYEGLAS